TQEAARAEIDKATGAHTAQSAALVGDEIHDTLAALEDPPRLASSGWSDLDHLLGGFGPGRLYVVGARPGVGKSVFGVQAAAYHARKHQAGVLIASLEMSRQEIHLRLLAQLARVPYNHLERHELA